MADPRTPPSAAGFTDMGGIVVPDAIYEKASSADAANWFGLDEHAELEGVRARREILEAKSLELQTYSTVATSDQTRDVIEAANQKLTALKAAQPASDPTLTRFMEGPGDWRLEFDSPYNRGGDYEQLGILGAYQLLREWNIAERMMVLTRCHMAWERNPLANAAVGLTTLFVVGKGLNVTYANPDVKAVIEDFINNPENDFDAMQVQACDALQIDGEVLLRYFPEPESGRLLVAPIMPWNIKWITTDPVVRKRIIAYHHQGSYWDGFGASTFVDEDIKPTEILHAKINALPYEVRGRPELFRILPWLKAYKDWLEERARVNRRQGSIYFHMKLANATPGMVSAARSAYKQPPAPGSIFVTNDNVELSVLSGNVRAGDAQADGQALKLMALAGLKLPEYMFGEGRHSTKGTASTQELPALAKFAYFQAVLVNSLWTPMFKRVIQMAVDAGILPETVGQFDKTDQPKLDPLTGEPKMIRAVDAFDCSYPDLQEPDPLNLAQALQIHEASGWAAKETVSGKAGYDYEVEQQKLLAEQAAALASAYTGGQMGMTGAPHAEMPLTSPPVPAQVSGPATATREAELFALVREALATTNRTPETNVDIQPSTTTINVPPTIVHITNQVETPQVHVTNDVRPSEVTVEHTIVPAAATEVTVNVPQQPAPDVEVHVTNEAVPVTLTMPSERITVKRNKEGQIVSMEKSGE